jgi:hypothetical protein
MADPQRTVCTASVWPHRHTNELTGPLDVKISYKNQPTIVRDWPKKKRPAISLHQPDERTNLTIIKLVFGHEYKDNNEWHRINQYRIRQDNSLKFYVKARITNQMEHPIPRGKWKGTCHYTNEWCVFTFQAMTMQVQPKYEPKIVLPDGSLPVKKTRIVIP